MKKLVSVVLGIIVLTVFSVSAQAYGVNDSDFSLVEKKLKKKILMEKEKGHKRKSKDLFEKL